MNEVFSINTKPEHHSVVTGGMMGLRLICDLIISDGDEVVMVGPVWPNIRSSVLLKKAAGIQKGSPTPHTKKVAKVTKDQLADIVKTKEGDLTGANLENSIKIIAGTARSMGIEVEE